MFLKMSQLQNLFVLLTSGGVCTRCAARETLRSRGARALQRSADLLLELQKCGDAVDTNEE